MFVANNYASFHLWWKENLLKHQKVSKYYDHVCRYQISATNNFDNLDQTPQKGYFQSKTNKMNTAIELGILELV